MTEKCMTIRSAIATIVGCTLLLAAVGAGVGYGLGTFAPEYYRSVFRGGWEPGFDPVSVGVGQGLTQGAAGGVAVGLALVAIFCWRQVRLKRAESSPAPYGVPVPTQSLGLLLLLVTGGLLALGFCAGSGFILGLLRGVGSAYHRQYLEEREALAPVLAGDPAFAGVEIREFSGGGAYLSGEVPTAADLDRLRVKVEHAIGARRAREALTAVGVRR
jgi:hypothetical protein